MDEPAIFVRELSPDDWELERALRLSALADSPSAFGSRLADAQAFDETEWRERLERQTRFAVWLDGMPVGTAGCVPAQNPYPSGSLVLVGMWVRSSARGKAVANRLVEAVVDWGREHGRTGIWLSVSHGNVIAERLYARHGFRRTGTDLEGDGDTFDMRRDLDPVRPTIDTARP